MFWRLKGENGRRVQPFQMDFTDKEMISESNDDTIPPPEIRSATLWKLCERIWFTFKLADSRRLSVLSLYYVTRNSFEDHGDLLTVDGRETLKLNWT